jgi:hypothetical protein
MQQNQSKDGISREHSESWARMSYILALHQEKQRHLVQKHFQLMHDSDAPVILQTMPRLESSRRCAISKLPKECSYIFLFKHHLQHLSVSAISTGFDYLHDVASEAKFRVWFNAQTSEAKDEFTLYFMAFQYHKVCMCVVCNCTYSITHLDFAC